MSGSNIIIEAKKYSHPLVGIIDTGFSANIPDIDYSQIYLGRDFIDGDGNPLIAKGGDKEHGSKILQIIRLANTEPIWLGRAVGSGKWAQSLVEFVDTTKASEQINKVVNLSFDLVQVNPDGNITTRFELTPEERDAIDYARQNGVLIVVAAGNEGSTISALGQASQKFDNIITVGGTKGLFRADYSSYGNGLTLLADGNSLGTSAATAEVTRAISDIWSVNPQLNYQQIADILKTTAIDLSKPGWDTETGFGLLHLSGAINLATLTNPINDYIYIGATSKNWQTYIEKNSLERSTNIIEDFWDEGKKFVEGAGKILVKVGEVVLDVTTFPFKTAGEAIKFVTDKFGDGLKFVFDGIGLDIVGDSLDWLIKRIGEKAQGIIERGSQYIEQLPSRIARTANDFFSDELWNNFGGWVKQNLTNAAELLGIPEVAETLADILKFNTRALDDREKEVAKSVFGNSINLDLVRIDEYSLANLVNSKKPGSRPFTTFNTINTWGSLDDATLIHELTHVWQYRQDGAIYIPDALAAQKSAGFDGMYPPGIGESGTSGYRYGGYTELEKRMANGGKLSEFTFGDNNTKNYEQQAKIVEDYYTIREDKNNGGTPRTDNDKYLPLYSYFVQEVSTLSLADLIPSSYGLVLGTIASDLLEGTNKDETLVGFAGDDFIDGGLGDDRMYGGIGNDSFFVNSPGDVVVEYPSPDIDTVNSSITYTLGDNLENLTLTGNDVINGTGNSITNIITGNEAGNVLNGSDGNDTLYGRGGNDTLLGGQGDDLMLGGVSDDTYEVNSIFDIITELLDEGNADTVNSSISYTLGDNLENLILTGNFAINGSGNSLKNTITGNNSNNFINGQAGNDTLNGEGGNDSIDGGLGDDLIFGGLGNDILNGQAGNDILNGGGGNDSIDGGLDDDLMSGGLGDDTYYVDSINDKITEFNNEGSDNVFASVSYTLSGNLENLTLTGNNAINGTGNNINNIITGNNSDNFLYGLDGKDILSGGDGIDYLDGGLDADSMLGGLGSDSYFVDNISDIITEFTNQGIDIVYSSVSYTLSDNLENLTLTDNSPINGIGNIINNIINGNDANNALDGKAGNDTLFGNGGNDNILGDIGDDKLIGGIGADILNGGDGIDTASYFNATSGITANLSTGQGSDGDTYQFIENLEGSEFVDRLFGDSQNNSLWGLAGDDTLNGLAGADFMQGGIGNDTYFIDNGGDTVTEFANQGIDIVNSAINCSLGGNLENLNLLEGTSALNGTGNELNNIINGNSANNIIDGAAGNDYLYGFAGSDTINGGDGNDWIVGGLGNDILTGGSGNDSFVCNSITDPGDRITDFTVGSDKIVLTEVVNSSGFRSFNPLADGFFSVRQAGSGLVALLIDADGAAGNSFRPAPFLLLNNISAAALNNSSNFVF